MAITGVLAMAIGVGLAPVGAADNAFPIAATPAREMARGIAFDGANYLVGIQGYGTSGRSDAITAQIVTPSGALSGGRIVIGQFGGMPVVAFDGTNYLLVWPSGGLPADINYGQFVSPAGSPIGIPFPITDPGAPFASLASGGGAYLLMYQKVSGVSGIYARVISAAGAVGPEVVVSEGSDQLAPNVAFDGSRFLLIWMNASGLLKGRFAELSGAMSGPEFTIATSAPVEDFRFVSVAWGNGRYLIVWDDPGAASRLVRGQLVDASGALVGPPTAITSAAAVAYFPGLAFDGSNFLATWTDARNDPDWSCTSGEGTCLDIYARFVAPSGAPVGQEFAVNPAAGQQLMAPAAFGAGNYLVAVTSGDGFDGAVGDVFGAFVAPLGTVPVAIGTNVVVDPGPAELTFSSVTSDGSATVVTLDPAAAANFSLSENLGAYEVSTTATYAGPITLCFPVSGISDAGVFNNLAIMHVENGVPIDRTTSHDFINRRICATVTSLSPFILVKGAIDQLAALVGVVRNFSLQSGIGNSFDAKLKNAQNALLGTKTKDKPTACQAMAAFLSEVQAQTGKSLSQVQAAVLVVRGREIRTVLGCQ